MTSSSSSAIDLAALSRKELQALAKEFQLCRGNAKSDVILQHVQRFVAENPADGEARVRAVLGGEAEKPSGEAPLKDESLHEQPTPAETKASLKTEQTVTPRKEEPAAKPASAKKTPEASTAKKSPAKSDAVAPIAAAATDAKKAKMSKKKAATSSPAAKKSPAKEAPVTATSPVKESAKSGRPALASLDANVVKSKKQSKLAAATVESLVNSIDDLAFIGDGSRVRCSTTGHEMKADVDAIDAYIHGKSYLRAKLKKQSFAAFAPMFVAHPDEKKAHLLWCSVTETEHPRDAARIEAHIAGSRYQKELPRWQEEEAMRVRAKQEAEARVAAKAQARATKLQQLQLEADKSAKARKQPKKSKNKRSRDDVESNSEKEATAKVVTTPQEEAKEAKRPRKKQAKK